MLRTIDPLSRRRELDYIEKDWLEKQTTGSAHEWDIYIVKELVDNALDADEAYGHISRIDIQMTYESDGLEIRVSNLAPFPGEHLERFFSLREYFTSKDYFNAPTRGAQGNALKTILGIPYALRFFYFSNYESLYKPLVITTGDHQYIVRFLINERSQTIKADIERRRLRKSLGGSADRKLPHGTEVFVGIDRFRQQSPRALGDLYRLALAYALWNPHATFAWSLQIRGERAQWEFAGNPRWHSKWSGTASPIHWYDYGQFRQLCFAFLQEHGDDYALSDFLSHFAGLDVKHGQGQVVLDSLKKSTGCAIATMGDLRIDPMHDHLLRAVLYPLMKRCSSDSVPTTLGCIGQSHIETILRNNFPIQGQVFYEHTAEISKDGSSAPFVLEAALVEVARYPEGNAASPKKTNRQILFGINHTPTYRDPFYVKQLQPLGHHSGEPVLGLDGFLDRYGLDQDVPIILAVHLICPNIRYQNYGKSEIDDEPFNATLCRVLHTVVARYQETKKERELDLHPIVWELMPLAIGEVFSNRTCSFTQGQLVHCLKRLIASKGEEYATWVHHPEANSRLVVLIVEYQQERGLISGLLRPLHGQITLPAHPDAQITVALARVHAADSLFRQYGAGKSLCVTNSDLEELLIANQFHNRYDLAILRSEGDFTGAFGAMVSRLERGPGMPVLLLHDASIDGCLLAYRLRNQLREIGVDVSRLVDLGLNPSQGQALGLWTECVDAVLASREQLTTAGLSPEEIAFLLEKRLRIGLEAFTPGGLANWFESRLTELGLSFKTMPSPEITQQRALEQLREKLGWHIEAVFHKVTGLPALQDRIRLDLQQRHRLTGIDFAVRVHRHLTANPTTSWEQALDAVTDGICREILVDDEIKRIREQVLKLRVS